MSTILSSPHPPPLPSISIDKGPLNLTNFGWSVDVQRQLRLACDAILSDLEDDVLDFYQAEKDRTVKPAARFCPRWCGRDEL